VGYTAFCSFKGDNISIIKLMDPQQNYVFIIYLVNIRDRVVGAATSYGIGDNGVGVRVPVGARFFSSHRRSELF
jgi:hypothetical protein